MQSLDEIFGRDSRRVLGYCKKFMKSGGSDAKPEMMLLIDSYKADEYIHVGHKTGEVMKKVTKA